MKTAINVVLIIIFLLIGYAIISQLLNQKLNFIPSTQIVDLPVVVKIDTVYVQTTIHDTVTIEILKIEYVENDTIVSTEYTPASEDLTGNIHISYSYAAKRFNIISNLTVHNKIIERTIERSVISPPRLLSLSAFAGVYGSKDDGVLSVGGGIIIYERFGIYIAALSTQKIGLQISFNWGL